MELCMGCVVKIKAGRDSGTFMAIVGIDDSRVYLVNGKDRVLGKPKAKNFRHITPTKMVLDKETMSSDRMINKKLREIGQKADAKGGGI